MTATAELLDRIGSALYHRLLPNGEYEGAEDDCAVCDGRAALAELGALVERQEEALRELAAVPAAGPFANKSACRAFAEFVIRTARAALAPAATEGQL